MDVIALSRAGFGASVAPLGTAVTETQLQLLWRITDEPVIALDGDAAGLRAAYRVIDIVQPEPMALGPSRARKAFGIAQAYEALVACHQAQSPFCTAMNAQLHASIPNFLIQENFDDSLEPWTWEVLRGVPRVDGDGYLTIPDAPGWGVELDEKEAAKHPYGERNFLRLFEEGWETRRPPEESGK
jgi:hypothetical protein